MTRAGPSVSEFHEFFDTYYSDKLAAFATQYPDTTHFQISYRDVWRWNENVADDLLHTPPKLDEWFTDALQRYQVGAVELTDAECVLVDLPNSHISTPTDIRHDDGGRYFGVAGDLSRVTAPDDLARVVAFECQRCGTINKESQKIDELREPTECEICDRGGPWSIDDSESEFVDFSRVRIETPPEDAGSQGTESIDGYVTGELVEYGHENGLIQRAGDRATIYGQIERTPKGSGANKKPLFERRFRVEAIEFTNDADTIDIADHREDFEQLAARGNAVELFKQSIAPELHATDAWQAALELGVAYLFGAPRLDIENGPTYRGDIHALLITDYGMGKSTFNEGIEQYSPKCINKSATGLSSDVGLLAAAVKDDFGAGQWTIKPGILVRGNGGHVILDEIDKPDADLSRMNDALEGTQQIDIEKAGQSATYQSRVGLMAMGNPEDARYDDHAAIADQIGIDETLLSRFDGIVTMRDNPDEETDAEIAERIINGLVEASEYTTDDRDEFDILDRPVPLEVGQAWIKYARDSVHPVARKEQLIDIRDWYATEVRQLNHSYASDGEGEGSDMPVPVTARVVEDTYRFAAAFARLHLRNEISEVDVERAKSLVKELVSQSWDGDRFVNMHLPPARSVSQQELVDGIKSVLKTDEVDAGMTIDTIHQKLNAGTETDRVDYSRVEHRVEELCIDGELYEPTTNHYRTI